MPKYKRSPHEQKKLDTKKRQCLNVLGLVRVAAVVLGNPNPDLVPVRVAVLDLVLCRLELRKC
jgi:hypothetical protein